MRCLVLLICLVLAAGCSQPAPHTPAPEPNPPRGYNAEQIGAEAETNPPRGLTEAFKTFHMGLAAERRADRIAALSAFFPTPEELKRAFPTKAASIQLIVEAWRDELIEHIDKVSEQSQKRRKVGSAC